MKRMQKVTIVKVFSQAQPSPTLNVITIHTYLTQVNNSKSCELRAGNMFKAHLVIFDSRHNCELKTQPNAKRHWQATPNRQVNNECRRKWYLIRDLSKQRIEEIHLPNWTVHGVQPLLRERICGRYSPAPFWLLVQWRWADCSVAALLTPTRFLRRPRDRPSSTQQCLFLVLPFFPCSHC